MTEKMNESIAYEMAMLLKENRSLKNECRELEIRIGDIDQENEFLKAEIEHMKLFSTDEDCDTDVEPGDKVVIHVLRGNPLICEGFVLTVKKNIYYNGKNMLLPCQMMDEDGNPRKGVGSCFSVSRNNCTWRKVDPSTPLTTVKKEGIPGTEHYRRDGSLDYYEKFTAIYENIYGGKNLTQEFCRPLYVKQEN